MLKTLTSVEEVESRCRFSGFLFQFYRFGPFGKMSGWRKQFVCLAPSSSSSNGNNASSSNLHAGSSPPPTTSATPQIGESDSLCLFFFTPDANNNMQIKFRTELALEQGCEARENFDATRENTFLVITSKQQLRLQATSPASRLRWVEALSTEFQRQVGSSLLEQKSELLRTGSSAFTWHQEGGKILKQQRLVVVGSDPTLLQLGNEGAAASVEFGQIEAVEAGNFHGTCASLKLAFHFNCFVIRLKDNGGTLDVECDKQSTRDDWVSALGAYLGESEVPRLRPAAASSFHNASGAVDAEELAEATRKLKPTASRKKNTLDANTAASLASGGSSANNANNTNTSSNAPGEFFKQKYTMKSDFPYSACISLALEHALGQPGSTTQLLPDRAVSKEDMDLVLTYPKFKHEKRTYEMVDYAPKAFQELRNRWGVSDTMFTESVGALSGDGAVGDGKSGMLFFFTRDRRFVLKTVKPNEMQVLSEFLRAYIKHMLEYSDTLICRFFGLYTFKFPGQQSISLVCMQNSFDTRLVLHEKYDLKGSTRNRWCTPRFGAVLKDLNFGTSKLYLDAEDRAALLEQCEKDTQLLEQFNVMDYSLLLGIHKGEQDEKGRRNLVLLSMASQLEPVHVRPNRWQRDFGGVEGFNPETKAPEVYVMCVIDLLQAYDFGKKAENLIKSQMTEVVSEISSVNPRTYRARFLAYLGKIIVGTQGQNAHIQAQRKEIKLRVFANAGGRPTTLQRKMQPVTAASTSSSAAAAARRKSAMAEVPIRLDKKPASPRASATTATATTAKATSPRRISTVVEVELPKLAASPAPAGVPTLVTSPAPAATTTAATTSTSTPTVTTTASPNNNNNNPPTPLSSPRATVGSAVLLALLDQDHQVEEGSLDEDQLKTEIQRAVLEAEETKNQAFVDSGGGAYTEQLEDGTEITILDNGGYIQRSPNGTVIHMFPDGSKRQTDPDGSTIDVSATGEITCHLPDGTEIVHMDDVDANVVDLQKNPDGSVIETWKDGTQIQRNQDGSRIETYFNGDKRTFFPDGVVVEQMGSGAVRQINPDGITILSMTNGTRIQTDSRSPHQILTTFPDGSMLQEDKADGMVIRTFPDHSELHTFPDGTVIEYLPSGYSKQTNKDETVIETYPDGRVVQTNRDGSVVHRRAEEDAQ